ncbi:MAG: hypothetical protein JSV20_01790 [Candidatus Bathyarchaeota archaeon]|nr:MAG: hypothetical protein JSV20_01790 [Candidatus Bathyarchaeota archaeon]
MKIKVVLYCFAFIFVLTSLNVVISVKGQSTVSTPMVAATPAPENYVSIKLQIPLSYSYAFWSHKGTDVFGTMKIFIKNPTPIVETVTITMPGKVDIAGIFEGSYETTYDKNMRTVTIISIPNKVSYSEINFVYSLNNSYITLSLLVF